ncbi:MAG: hypothetical protein WBA28_05205 [Microbacteriaceae bacterium]
MKKLALIIVGGAIGFVAAHQFGKTENGKKFFNDIDRRVDEVSSAVVEGYKKQESELKSVLADVEAAIKDFKN